MVITYVYADIGGAYNSSWWRMAQPAVAMMTRGHICQLIPINEFADHSADDRMAGSDIIIVQRNLFEPVTSVIRHWRDKGKAVALDADDAYHLLTPAMPVFKFWHLGQALGSDHRAVQIHPTPLEQYRDGLRWLDGVILSTPLLAEDHFKMTDRWRIFTVPNFLEPAAFIPTSPRPKVDGQIVIGWGGSLGRLSSFIGSGLLSALGTISQEIPATRFLLVGEDTELFDRLPFPAGRKDRLPWLSDISQWPNVLAGFDVGVAPSHGASDERRSFIKALEYAALGIPYAASNTRTYNDPMFSELASTGVVADSTPQAWVAALRSVIERRAEARINFDVVQHYSLRNPRNLDHIERTYAQIILNSKLRG